MASPLCDAGIGQSLQMKGQLHRNHIKHRLGNQGDRVVNTSSPIGKLTGSTGTPPEELRIDWCGWVQARTAGQAVGAATK